ncbi:MAG TPA: HAD-IIIA family hydrolase [Saprospiraceae bacterium]|nr:HAD-IIIA family hydrolase [Saprospiraceae bacterium]
MALYKKLPLIDISWTLFLDRDGVINIETGDYIYKRDEFEFNPGALDALRHLSEMFGRIVVVTNQRGVGKGWMTLDDLLHIHEYMLDEIKATGGRIDAIFYNTAVEDDHQDRKPNPGMTKRAQDMFPEIDFNKSIVVGDKLADMQLARNIGAISVLIPSLHSNDLHGHADVDFVFHSLFDFADQLRSN